MSTLAASPKALPVSGNRSAAYIVQWLRELEECRVGGLITRDEYALERSEKLSELLCRHRGLWIAPVVAAGSCAAIVGSLVWAMSFDWQATSVAAALGAVFGLAMLSQPCRENLKHAQVRDRLEILNSLLSLDLVSADEFIIYEERLLAGQNG
jgi:hypothetical protein